MKHPFSQVTRGLETAVESTDKLRAMIDDAPFIANTWGNLAQQVIAADLAEPSIDAVCAYLMIEPNKPRSPDQYNIFQDPLEARRNAEELKIRNLNSHLANAARQFEPLHELITNKAVDWAVNDVETQVDSVQAKIDSNPRDDSERDAILCLTRDAYASGVSVSLLHFLETIVEHDGSGSSVITTKDVLTAVNDVIEDIRSDYFFEDGDNPTLDSLVLGKDQIDYFITSIRNVLNQKAKTRAMTEWTRMSSLLYPPSADNHVLVSGGEK